MSETPERDAPLRWTVHPAAEDPRRAILVALFVLLGAAFAGTVGRSGGLALAAALLLGLSLRAYFLPRTYVLDGWGARESGPLQAPRRIAWDAVRRVTRERYGVYLSPLHRVSRLLPDRGVFLRTADNAESVEAYVAEHGPAA